MFHKDGSQRRTWRGRAFSLFLSAALLLGSVPGFVLPVSAHWADPYLDQLVDWGVMRADQTSNPDAPLTRAEFMAIINRAYGYNEMGEMPFTDVQPTDWFYDDVAIAYHAGYMKGTSETTAAPNARLTREQAVCILGRNMMLKERPGEDLTFADSRSISGWARGMIKSAADHYIVAGYPDDTFRPKDNITKGQMAVLVTQCVGAQVNAGGAYELGDVSGNLTITSPNVTLRNTTISGDLYVSGGVGLGGIKLENVNVLGRIVVSGTGESENGSASVIMRNVSANELLVDNMRKGYVTVRADGITEIPNTIVRTNAYLEDNNTDDKGLLNITLEGDSGTRLDLAGRIKNVLDKTPNSFVQVAKGTVARLTVDEAATNSVIQINRNTEVKELNLDVGANVNGEGSVGKLNINAPGSTVTMLPDKIYIRPGITGNVNGIVMDSAAAEESSLDPRLLSGYPAASDVTPTGLRADFAGNKKGTVYWAVSDIADGSIGAEDLISPPSYGSKAVRGGSVGLPAGDTVGSAQISGLTVGGSYYLSAVLVDGRDERSPVKVISFTTPDNTVPAFAQGYPYMSLVTNTMAQVTVMPTKTCKLYYAVLPKGAPAPTAKEMRSASVTGNLGYGIVDVVKNTERVFNVSNRLQELKEYTLYLWLTDADGVNSSAVIPVQFKTVDKTPPEFNPDPDPSAAVEEDDNVKLTAGLNEQGTIYWVAVPKGKPYPPVNPGSDPIYKDNIMSGSYDENGDLTDINGGTPVSSRLNSEFAKLQVKNHKGSSVTAFNSVAVPNADTEVNIDVRGLKEATAYDFYYVAEDQAGNFSKEVKKITIKTKDTVGPVVTQCFRDAAQGKDILIPKSGDVVVLKFNEDIKASGLGGLLDLGRKDLEDALNGSFKLYYLDAKGDPQPVGTDKTQTTWVDYSKVTVREGQNGAGGIEVVFDPAQDALKMVSGRTYYFELTGITDLSDNNPKGFDQANNPVLNYDTVDGTDHVLGQFTVAPASVKLSKPAEGAPIPQPDWVKNTYMKDKPDNTDAINKAGYASGGKRDNDTVQLARVDGTFYVDPESTSEMGENYYYDIVLFSEKAMDYDVYYRALDPKNGEPVANQENYRLRTNDTAGYNGWAYLGNVKNRKAGGNLRNVGGLNRDAERNGYSASINNLTRLQGLSEEVRYEFAISVTKLGSSSNFETWGDKFKVYVDVIAGGRDRVDQVIRSGSATEETITNQTGISVISDPLYITMDFSKFDAPPMFYEGPKFTPGYARETDEYGNEILYPSTKIRFSLDNPGTLFYRIVPKGAPLETTAIEAKKAVGSIAPDTPITAADEADLWEVISAQTNESKTPGKLDDRLSLEYYSVDGPATSEITGESGRWITYDREDKKPEEVTLSWNPEEIAEGQPYYIYIALKSDASDKMHSVYIYNFTSGKADTPKLLPIHVNNGHTFSIDTDQRGDPIVHSDIRWRIFHESDAKTILDQPFTVNAFGSEPTGYDGVTTILDALTTEFDSDTYYAGYNGTSKNYSSAKNGYSVFDVLATDTDRRTVYNETVGTSTLTVYGGNEEGEPTKNYHWEENWYNAVKKEHDKEDIERTQYLILVGGYDTQLRQAGKEVSVDKYSFRALPVSLDNKSAPEIMDASGGWVDFKEVDKKWVLCGRIEIQFDPNKPVYWRNSKNVEDKVGKIFYLVSSGSSGPTGSGDNATVGILANQTDNTFTNGEGKGGTFFTLDFDGVTSSSSKTILPGGQGFYTKNGDEAGTPLQIKFTVGSVQTEKVDPDDPSQDRHYRIGRWEVWYRGKPVPEGFQEIKKYVDELEEGKPSAPQLVDKKASFSGSLGGTDSLTATVDLYFKGGTNGDLYTKSGSNVTKVTDITAGVIIDPPDKGVTVTKGVGPYGGKYTIKVNFGTITKDTPPVTIVLLNDTELFENTGTASTKEMIRIEISAFEQTVGVTKQVLGQVDVYFGTKQIGEPERQNPSSSRRS